MATGNIINATVDFPIKAVIPAGKSGDGFNYFRAPSKWDSIALNLGSGVEVAVIAAVANRAIRLYRYILDIYGANNSTEAQFTTSFGAALAMPIMQHTALAHLANVRAAGHFVFDASPVGISPAGNVGFFIQNTGGAATTGRIFVQWSTEGWGLASKSDGSDIA